MSNETHFLEIFKKSIDFCVVIKYNDIDDYNRKENMENKIVGRPVNPNKRTKRITVRFTEKELEELREKAKYHNFSIEEYVRYLIKKN